MYKARSMGPDLGPDPPLPCMGPGFGIWYMTGSTCGCPYSKSPTNWGPN